MRLPHCRPSLARRQQDRIDTGARRLAEAVEGPSCNHVDAAAVAGLAAALARAAAAGSAPALPAPSAATATPVAAHSSEERDENDGEIGCGGGDTFAEVESGAARLLEGPVNGGRMGDRLMSMQACTTPSAA